MRVACHQCQTVLKVPSHLAGQTAKCPRCSTDLVIPASPPAPPPPPFSNLQPDPKPPSDDLVRIVHAVRDVRDAVEAGQDRTWSTTMTGILFVIRLLIWGGLFVHLASLNSSYRDGLGLQQSAIQQAAFAADACFRVIIAYCVVRGLDSLTRK